MTYEIGRLPDADPAIDEAIERLRGRSTGTLGHWKSLGYAHGLMPLLRPAHAVGEVVTARISAFDASPVHYAVSLLEPGQILVVDTGGEDKRAPWGGGTSYAAYQAGAAGVVVDGPVTDWDEITTMGVQTWSRGTTSLTYRASAPEAAQAEGGVNIPVRISGALVKPGDIAFADSDGVVFLRREDVMADGKRLVEVTMNERETWRALAHGTKLSDVRGQRAKFEESAMRISEER